MNMDEYFVLFREYMLVQKPSSVNTRDSYLRDVSAFLRYLEGENITSPLEVETETMEACAAFAQLKPHKFHDLPQYCLCALLL